MRPIYKSVVLESAILAVSLSLQAKVNDGSDVTTVGVDASTLDGLRVEFASPKVSGALDLIASGAAVVSGSTIAVTLGGFEELATLEQVTYRLTVKARYGTQVRTLYALDITVPRGTPAGGTQEYEDSFAVVSTFGDGGADAAVYALDENGNAHITKPLKVSGSVREGGSTVASGYNSHAEGVYAIASGYSSHAEGAYTIASGDNSHAEGAGTTASGGSSHAEGRGTTASGGNSHAEGAGTTSGGVNSHAEGEGTIASQNNQHVCGQFNVEDSDNSFLFIVGNGADAENRHNAFAVTRSGELALFKADGTPVILDAAKLEALIASVS